MRGVLLAACGVGSFGAPLSWRYGGFSLVGRCPPLLRRSASLAAAACTCASRAPAAGGEGDGRPSHAEHPAWPQGGSLAGSSVTMPALPRALATTVPLGGATVPG